MEGRKDLDYMLGSIAEEFLATYSYTGIPCMHANVAQALYDVPRHYFVPSESRQWAYENRPLPILHNQTISQPYIVAIMTELLNNNKETKVLEIGTGSGYQAAVLSKLAKEVYSIDIIEDLVDESRQRMDRMGYDNVHVACRDGHEGWPEMAPFDNIIITAAAEKIPAALIRQLKINGHIVMPLGTYDQWLVVIKKLTEVELDYRKIIPVRFVPFV